MSLEINTKTAKPISWSGSRDLKNILYIVIHYTGNKGDTAKNNAVYFSSSNTRKAGAHYFVDKSGEVWSSVPLNKIANAVGGNQKSGAKGEAKYYGKCTNTNSVSIELCDCLHETNWEQMLTCRELVQYIQKKCPNAKTILRHWDVNGKNCPAPMAGMNHKKWEHFKCFLKNGYQYKAIVTKNAALRSSDKVAPANKIGSKKKGAILRITKIKGNWGRLKSKDSQGRYRWITLSKLKEIS